MYPVYTESATKTQFFYQDRDEVKTSGTQEDGA
jgi:hypothetical protein